MFGLIDWMNEMIMTENNLLFITILKYFKYIHLFMMILASNSKLLLLKLNILCIFTDNVLCRVAEKNAISSA